MTRQDILNQYVVVNGIIKSPGKFEEEPIYAPYFWELSQDGGGEDFAEVDEEGNEFLQTSFIVEPGDVDEFPELEGIEEVLIWDDDQGFVYCEASPRSED